MWFSTSNFPTEGKTAIIIGASQGIGAELALKLYQHNCSVILVARTESKLIQQVKHITTTIGEKSDVKCIYYTCDVSNYDNCETLWEKVIEDGYDPDIIFCCAGSSIPKLFNDLTKHDIQSGITTNYNTAINAIHTGFKQMLDKGKTKPRHIILFSSVVGFYPFIGYSQYAPMKSAIQSLSIVLRQELAPYNYRVSCVFPGNFQSEGYEQEQKTKPEITKKIEGSSHAIPGEECAELIIDQLRKGYDTITTDLIGWLLGCSVLGVLPRQWGFLQIIVSFLFSIFAPIANWFVNRDIESYFNQTTKKDE